MGPSEDGAEPSPEGEGEVASVRRVEELMLDGNACVLVGLRMEVVSTLVRLNPPFQTPNLSLL